jgi:hypothetical protein
VDGTGGPDQQKLRACSPAVSEPTPGLCPAAGDPPKNRENRENREVVRRLPRADVALPMSFCLLGDRGNKKQNKEKKRPQRGRASKSSTTF